MLLPRGGRGGKSHKSYRALFRKKRGYEFEPLEIDDSPWSPMRRSGKLSAGRVEAISIVSETFGRTVGVVPHLQTPAGRNQPGAKVPVHFRRRHLHSRDLEFLLVRSKDRKPGHRPDQQGVRVRAEQTLANIHYKKYLPGELRTFVDELSGERAPLNNRPKFESHVIDPFSGDPDRQPRDDFERKTVEPVPPSRRSDAEKPQQSNRVDPQDRPERGAADSRIGQDRGQDAISIRTSGSSKSNCLVACHQTRDNALGKTIFNKPDDLAGAIAIRLPLEETNARSTATAPF